MIRIIIAMAGEGRRFLNAGFTEPKFKLMAKNRPLFDWALSGLKHFFSSEEFLFATIPGQDEFIKHRCHILGIKSHSIIPIHYKTTGQAATVRMITGNLPANAPVLIHNIDTFLHPDSVLPDIIPADCDGWLQLFQAQGSHWSFAELGEEWSVISVSEKVRISDYASTGLYYFGSAGIFNAAYDNMADDVISKYGEAYVAPLYNFLIKKKMKVCGYVTPCGNIIPLGTPDELLAFDPDFYAHNIVRLGKNPRPD